MEAITNCYAAWVCLVTLGLAIVFAASGRRDYHRARAERAATTEERALIAAARVELAAHLHESKSHNMAALRLYRWLSGRAGRGADQAP